MNCISAQVLTIPSIKRLSPEGVEFIEYLGDDVQDEVFMSLLQKLHRKFVLLNDSMEAIEQTKGLDELRSSLKIFFDSVSFLTALHLFDNLMTNDILNSKLIVMNNFECRHLESLIRANVAQLKYLRDYSFSHWKDQCFSEFSAL